MRNDHPSVGEIGLEWWRDAIDSDTGRTRKTKAELRRAGTTLAVLGVSAVHDLKPQADKRGIRVASPRRWAGSAGTDRRGAGPC